MAHGHTQVITFTGITGQLREYYKSLVARLHALYSGSLQVGQTTVLVAPSGDLEQLSSSAKYQLAQASGIPIVCLEWLDDSSSHGSLLDYAPYRLCGAQAEEERLRTAESRTASEQPRAAPAAAAAEEEAVPSVEKLRAAVVPQHLSGGKFMLAAGSPAGALLEEEDFEAPSYSHTLMLQHEDMMELPASPPKGPLFSPLALGSQFTAHTLPSPGAHGLGCSPAVHSAAELLQGMSAWGSPGQQPGATLPPEMGATPVSQHTGSTTGTPSSSQAPAQLPACRPGGAVETGPAATGPAATGPAAVGPAAAGASREYVPTTKVVLGRKAPLGCPSHIVAQSLLQHHGLRSLQHVAFYSSAKLKLADGRTLRFEAGDASHGAKMVYDTTPRGGTRLWGHSLVLAIYTLGEATAGGKGGSEVWFAHKYLLGREDLQERPRWAGFLKEAVVREDELLLGLGLYHSPLALVEEEFGVAYKGTLSAEIASLRPSGCKPYLPVMECRRGFDQARGKGVQLKTALREVL